MNTIKNNPKANDFEKLNALVDDELNEQEREALFARLDEPELRGELCDIHRIKDLLNFAYPLMPKTQTATAGKSVSSLAIVASFLLILSVGFIVGYFSSPYFNSESFFTSSSLVEPNKAELLQAEALPIAGNAQNQNKVIIYLGSSEKNKFNETLNKAESLLKQYQEEGTSVYVVTSAGGIDMLRVNNNVEVQQRIKRLKGLFAKNLHFVACNNQIYELHKKGQPVNLVDEVEVAPSAVQFVVDHLKKGWKYIAI